MPTDDERITALRTRVHKASPATPYNYHCAVCGQPIKQVPGGQGSTYVHADSGAVAAPNPPSSCEGVTHYVVTVVKRSKPLRYYFRRNRMEAEALADACDDNAGYSAYVLEYQGEGGVVVYKGGH